MCEARAAQAEVWPRLSFQLESHLISATILIVRQQAAGSPVLRFVSQSVKTDVWICFSSNAYTSLLSFFLLPRQLLFLIVVLFVWVLTKGHRTTGVSPWDLPDKFKSRSNIPHLLLLLLSLKNYVVSSSFFSSTYLLFLPGGRVGGVCFFLSVFRGVLEIILVCLMMFYCSVDQWESGNCCGRNAEPRCRM